MGGLLPNFHLSVPWEKTFGVKLIPVPATSVLTSEFTLLCGLGGPQLKSTLIPVFSTKYTPTDSLFVTPNPLRGVLSLFVVSLSRISLSIPDTGEVNLGNEK